MNKLKLLILSVILGLTGIKTTAAQTVSSPRDSARTQAVQDFAKDPALLNNVAAQLLSAVKDSAVADFIRDLHIDFKTFQATDQPAGLGFSYQYQNTWTFAAAKHQFSQSLNIDLNGNVAFREVYNPVDFLESKVVYNANFFWGGISRKNNPAEAKAYFKAIRDLSSARKSGNDAAATQALAQMDALHQISDQFFISLNAAPTYDSNQDFSRQAFAPEAYAVFGANGYDAKSTLGWWNLPDYPFALLRYIFDPGGGFKPSGVSFPTFMAGLDYVVPTQDSLRKAVIGALNPYSRVHLEVSFKTHALTFDKQVIYFTADYRFYQEINPSVVLRAAGIARFNYFVAELQGSSGFFVSYSAGQLPFDRKSDQVYSLGFKYNLGNSGTNSSGN